MYDDALCVCVCLQWKREEDLGRVLGCHNGHEDLVTKWKNNEAWWLNTGWGEGKEEKRVEEGNREESRLWRENWGEGVGVDL